MRPLYPRTGRTYARCVGVYVVALLAWSAVFGIVLGAVIAFGAADAQSGVTPLLTIGTVVALVLAWGSMRRRMPLDPDVVAPAEDHSSEGRAA
jgi:hypothetical protein